MVVVLVGSGVVGVITAIRRNRYASDGLPGAEGECENNPKTKLPDYVEIDGDIQVHPSRVRRVK